MNVSLDNWKKTPLHCAASNGHTEIVKLLLENQAPIDSLDCNNWTPLHYATRWGHKETIILLLQNKADKNIKNQFERTSFQEAKYHGVLLGPEIIGISYE